MFFTQRRYNPLLVYKINEEYLFVGDYIYTYVGMEWDINKYIKKLYKISRDESIIFLHYIFQYYSNNYTRNKSLIWGVNNQNVLLQNVSIKKLPLEKESKIGDGMILIKK